MVEEPIAVEEIDDPENVRVMLFVKGKQAHIPLRTLVENVIPLLAPKVVFGANTTKSIASGTLTTLDDLDTISDGTLGNSTLSNGVFTVGAGDGGIYLAILQYKPIDTGGGYTAQTALIVPSSGVNGVKTEREASGSPVWMQAAWLGALSAGSSLTFRAAQVNGGGAARASDTGSRAMVVRLWAAPV